MKEYWIVYTGKQYSIPNTFSTYKEAKDYYEDCKEWIRDSYLTLTKVTEETLENEFIEWEDM